MVNGLCSHSPFGSLGMWHCFGQPSALARIGRSSFYTVSVVVANYSNVQQFSMLSGVLYTVASRVSILHIHSATEANINETDSHLPIEIQYYHEIGTSHTMDFKWESPFYVPDCL